jgi:sulfate transport system ATP-binding protein
MSIEAKALTKRFGNVVALDRVDLEVASGGLTALLGPSGSGKTTLLRLLAGLEAPDPGPAVIRFSGTDVTNVSPGERRVGFVFQSYALFPHLSVFENVAFGLRVRPRARRPAEDEIRSRVTELLTRVQLGGLAARYPDQLSGGQRQRVALARALATDPAVLLLDEPFGALDAKVRRELRAWLREFHAAIRLTTVFVTHDQEEALEIADEVVVMNHARIEQTGPPPEVYDVPATPFVSEFLGAVNRVPLRGGEECLVRPHELRIVDATDSERDFVAVIHHVHVVGPLVRVIVRRYGDDADIEIDLSRREARSMTLHRALEVGIRADRVARAP